MMMDDFPPERVRRLQEGLTAAGFDAGPVDGVMGERTRAALREFQRARGLDPTGEPNQATLTELGVE
jgi:peptidoglycan hydrolase-like protein with peptidoglycan-binding domain